MATAQPLPRPRHRWFAFLYARFIEPSGRRQMDPLRDFTAGGARGRVLEIGAGTGINLQHYDWSQVESLEMAEPDPFMAQHIAPKLTELPAEARAKVRLLDAPAEQLPFPDASFDCAVVTLVLCSVSDLTASIAELHRVVRPGGELRIVEHVKGKGTRAKIQSLVQPVYGWTSGDCQLSRETEQALRAGGFDVEVSQRTALGPLWPVIVGVARRRD